MTTENPRPPALADYDPHASADFLSKFDDGDTDEQIGAVILEQWTQALVAERTQTVTGEAVTTTHELPDIAAHAGGAVIGQAMPKPRAASEQLQAGFWKNRVPEGVDFSNTLFECIEPEGAIPRNWLPDRPKQLARGSLERYGWPDGAKEPTPGSLFAMHGYTEADIQSIELVEPDEENDIAIHEELVSVVGRKAINVQCDIVQTHPILMASCGEKLLKEGIRGLVKELMQNAYRHAGGVTGVRIYASENGTFVGIVSDPCPERTPKTSLSKARTFYSEVREKAEKVAEIADDEVIVGDPQRIDHGRGSAFFDKLCSEYGYWIEPGVLEIAVPDGQPRTPLPPDEKHMWFRIGPEDIARVERQRFDAAA